LCSERTSQGLGLLHHKVAPSAVCRALHGSVRYRKEGQQIFCLGDDEKPAADRKIDLADYCRTNYGQSAIVSRRLTDDAPLCTVKGNGGLSQVHHLIDVAELCGSGSGSVNEKDELDCTRRGASGNGRVTNRKAAPERDGQPAEKDPEPRRQGAKGDTDRQDARASGNDPAAAAMRTVDGDLSGCWHYYSDEHRGKLDAEGEDPIWGGVSFPCPGLPEGGWTTTPLEYCHALSGGWPRGDIQVRYAGTKPYCWIPSLAERTPFNLQGACMSKFEQLSGVDRRLDPMSADEAIKWSCSLAVRWQDDVLTCHFIGDETLKTLRTTRPVCGLPVERYTIEFVTAEAPHVALPEIVTGSGFRVRLEFDKAPSRAEEPITVANKRSGETIELVARRTSDPKIFLTAPVNVVGEVKP
jgi:hypothetical protein